MEIGKKIILIKDKTKYRTKIIDMDEQYIYLDVPIHTETEKSVFLPVETRLQIKYAGRDGAAYKFTTEIVNHKILRVPTVVIPFPQSIKRIQRREFVRVQTAVDVAVHSLNNKFAPFTTVTYDISAGGASIILSSNSSVNVNDHVELLFVLHMYNGNINYIPSQAKLLRIDDHKHQPLVGSLQFLNISAADQQIIVQFCLEKQRKARQKELN